MEEADATRGVDTQRMDAMGDAVDQVGIGSGADQGGTGGQSSSRPANPVWCGPQVHAYQEAVVAVFPEAEQAEAALTTLQQAGLAADQVGLAARTAAR